MVEDNLLYKSVVNITRDYLGPAADRFIDRQIVNHLDKKPNDLNARDMNALTGWLRVAFSILTDDQDLIDEYFKRLNKLTNTKRSSSGR